MTDLTQMQSNAVDKIEHWLYRKSEPEFYLAGYAGSGKTTLIAYIINAMPDEVVRVATYTGKASLVLRQKGLDGASTIHRLIYIPKDTKPITFDLRTELPPTDLIILDEVSMVSTKVAKDLRSFNVKMLVVGDPGQLPPPKGEGEFTNRSADFFLSEIHRQALDSPILRWATEARLGKSFSFGDNIHTQTRPFSLNLILNSDYDIIICGLHRSRWNLTAMIREHFGIKSPYPVVGEPVICCRNNYRLGLYNGMIGTLLENATSVEQDGMRFLRMIVDFDGEIVEVASQFDLFDQHVSRKAEQVEYEKGLQIFDFAYAITCHKAQGSEWKSVLIVDDSYAFREDKNRWLYTAITRASEKVTITSMRP